MSRQKLFLGSSSASRRGFHREVDFEAEFCKLFCLDWCIWNFFAKLTWQ